MQPLKDVRVLSVTAYLAGPFLSMTVARFGAEVIKVETPGRGDPIRLTGPFAGPQRRPSNTADRGRPHDEISITQRRCEKRNAEPKGSCWAPNVLDMAKESDVVLENLAPGSMKRLGLRLQRCRGSEPTDRLLLDLGDMDKKAPTPTIQHTTTSFRRCPA